MNSLENRLTVANEMLSLLGSLQAEPFSSRYDILKGPCEVTREDDGPSSSEDTFGLLGKHEAKRKTSRSQERTDSEKKRKRK